jgi:hypothetical protein
MDAAAKNRAAAVIASVRPGEELPIGATPAGFTRRRAGRISLDVPARLTPPSAFVFASGDASLSIAISGSVQSWSLPAGEILDREMEAFFVDGTPATIIRFVLLRNPLADDRRWAYRRAQIIFDDGVTVQLEGRAPVEQSGVLDEAFRNSIRNVRRTD